MNEKKRDVEFGKENQAASNGGLPTIISEQTKINSKAKTVALDAAVYVLVIAFICVPLMLLHEHYVEVCSLAHQESYPFTWIRWATKAMYGMDALTLPFGLFFDWGIWTGALTSLVLSVCFFWHKLPHIACVAAYALIATIRWGNASIPFDVFSGFLLYLALFGFGTLPFMVVGSLVGRKIKLLHKQCH